jgi:hypothetical protein
MADRSASSKFPIGIREALESGRYRAVRLKSLSTAAPDGVLREVTR